MQNMTFFHSRKGPLQELRDERVNQQDLRQCYIDASYCLRPWA